MSRHPGFAMSLMTTVVFSVTALAMQSPGDMVRSHRVGRMKAFSKQCEQSFGSAELGRHSAAGFLYGRNAVERRYDVHVLVVDSCGEQAGIVAALLQAVAKGAKSRLHVQTASLVPALPRDGMRDGEEGESCSVEAMRATREAIRATRERLGLEASTLAAPSAIRPRDLCCNGGFDVALTTDLSVLEQVRQLQPKNKGTVGTFCLADFIMNPTGSGATEASSVIAAVIALPKPLRAVLASEANTVGSPLYEQLELPKGSPVDSEAWNAFLAAAIASSLGFTVRLNQSMRSHARDAVVGSLFSHYPTLDSLKALEPTGAGGPDVAEAFSSRVPVGVLSATEYRGIIQAYSAALQILELGAVER